MKNLVYCVKRPPERVTEKVVKLGSNCPNTGFHNFEQSFFFQDSFVEAKGESESVEQTKLSPAKIVVERSTHNRLNREVPGAYQTYVRAYARYSCAYARPYCVYASVYACVRT